ncbi:hypothetical protein RRG08_041499 [Elysia crispata]|uniref:Uncharacterized protein n=1 Tax=Elysia crispata TaxID=231223 RepID=A0AAE0Y2J0_9GAST|nr:hypothetical protein RRG08_041499 [Elysia crispata]
MYLRAFHKAKVNRNKPSSHTKILEPESISQDWHLINWLSQTPHFKNSSVRRQYKKVKRSNAKFKRRLDGHWLDYRNHHRLVIGGECISWERLSATVTFTAS